jgi:hypothetical protein
MKQLELLMRLQRLLDEESIAGGPDDEADLIEEMEDLDELEDLGTGSGEMREVFGMLKDKDDLGGELEELLGGGDLEGVEAELGLTGLGMGSSPEPETPGKRRERGAERPLQRLLKDLAERRGQRAGATRRAGGERPIGRLLDLLKTLGELRDRQSETTELRRLKKFMFSRQAPGGLGAAEPRDPVAARRKKQLQEFFAAWREALDNAPAESARAPESESAATAPATAPRAATESTGRKRS